MTDFSMANMVCFYVNKPDYLAQLITHASLGLHPCQVYD